jgi:crossover junction endodeoxyribonuclease RusA
MSLVVLGRPVPQGSKRVFNGNLVDANSKQLRPWRAEIAAAAYEVWPQPLPGALSVWLDFFFARPLGHYGVKGLRPSAPDLPAVRPDLDKLVRAVLDALTGIAFRDDSQAWEIVARKRYADAHPQGLVVRILSSEAPATVPG